MCLAGFQIIDRAGRGAPWLVLVHGASQHSGLFSGQIDAFAPRFRLLLVDLPGHGRSTHVPGPYGPVEYAAAVDAAIERAGIEHCHFWGTHTGAGVGLLLAASNPARLRSLVLEGAVVPGEPMPYVARAIERAKLTARTRGVGAAVQEWYATTRWFDVVRRDPGACRAAEKQALLAEFEGGLWLDERVPAPTPDIRRALARLQVPTLLINGEHDLDEFIDTADRLEHLLPDVARATIAAAGGFPLWERPEAVNAVVLAFLDRL